MHGLRKERVWTGSWERQGYGIDRPWEADVGQAGSDGKRSGVHGERGAVVAHLTHTYPLLQL